MLVTITILGPWGCGDDEPLTQVLVSLDTDATTRLATERVEVTVLAGSSYEALTPVETMPSFLGVTRWPRPLAAR